MSETLSVVTKNLHKSFSDGSTKTHVLKGIHLECRPAEMLMIVGPSGCGKTTLLSCIAGTLEIDEGEVRLLGQNITAMSEEALISFRRAHLGFIFQQFNLIPTLNLTENVSIPLILNGYEEEEAEEISSRMLSSVGLGEKLKQRPSQLSGGQQQRVAIARALVHKPELVICDEPTSSLDGKTGHSIVALLKEIAQNSHRSVILVTHDSRIFHFADRIVEMDDGRIKQIYNDPSEFTRKSL